MLFVNYSLAFNLLVFSTEKSAVMADKLSFLIFLDKSPVIEKSLFVFYKISK